MMDGTNTLVDYDLEHSLICALNREFTDVTDIIKSEDIVQPDVQIAFEVFHRLQKNVDTAVLTTELREAGLTDPVSFLTKIMTIDGNVYQCRGIAKKLRKLSIRRGYALRLEMALQDAQNPLKDISDLPDVTAENIEYDVGGEIKKPVDAKDQMEAYI